MKRLNPPRSKKQAKENRRMAMLLGTDGNGNGYDPTLHPQLAERACKSFGMSIPELSRLMGIAEDILYSWMDRHQEFYQAIKRGQDFFTVQEVEGRALYQRATGYSFAEQEHRRIRVRQGEAHPETGEVITESDSWVWVCTKRTEKHVPPNMDAIKFYLTNRAADRWQNISQVNISGQAMVQHMVQAQFNVDVKHKVDVDSLAKKLGNDELEVLMKVVGGLEGNQEYSPDWTEQQSGGQEGL